MEYTVIIEGSPEKGYGAYSPDIPVYATGKTEKQVRSRMTSGIRFHLRCLKEAGDPIPEPRTKVYVEHVALP